MCVALASALASATIPLTNRAIQAIQDASPTVRPAAPGAGGLGALVQSPTRTQPDTARPETPAERQIRQEEALERLGLVCLAVVGVFALRYAFVRGQTYYLSRAAAKLALELRERLFAKLQRLPVSYFNEKRQGGLQSVLTNDINVYQNAVSLIRDSIDGPAKALFALVWIVLIQWQLALVALLFVPVIAAFVHRNGRKMKEAQGQVQDDLASLASMSQEAIAGARVVKAFAAEERMRSHFGGLLQRGFESQMRAVRRFAELKPMVEFLGATSLAAILFICGFMAQAGTLAIADIVSLTVALDLVNQGMKSLANVNNVYNQVQAAADRIHAEVLDVPDEHLDRPGARTLPQPQGTIEFRDVVFEYPDGTRALNGVSFTIPAGTSLALVGPSGAGKSTIADLLLRFYDPTSGAILYDGVDVRELDLGWYRRLFGVVPQSTFLFAGSIADNLRLGAGEASDEDLRRAAALASADGFIEATPNRYETTLGERGVRLSGGEGQRLAIARALVGNPEVLLLDEATSNLDAVSEKAVTQAIEKAMAGRTTLFIAHRLTTAARADRILVLRRGEVLETGSHDDLVRQNGAYAGMYRAFVSGVLEVDA